MKKMTGFEIRKMWLDFFISKDHHIIPSAPLVPFDDPSLLWINAGIAPLKKYFDGREKPSNPRMANAQKSLRTNDIDNVGKTARHHTFFEMLGNFSIGDYFRDEALFWAMELLTSPQWFGFDIEKLYFTYYPTDFETRDLWLKLGVNSNHLIPLAGNFWEIGEGPCGPCTEIFYDRGEKFDREQIGIKLLKDDIENDRYIEIWNIVFSQFNAIPGLSRDKYPELPSKNIDTGMGLERMACIIQGVNSNYETDLFLPLIQFIETHTMIKYTDQMSFRVICDHIRSVVFALSDGATFSNESRGYVLRRLLRRAVRHGRVLGINQPFLYQLVEIVMDIMKDYYPYLINKQEIIEQMIITEEINFLKTLENGEKKLLEIIHNYEGKIISGSDAFLLYDTFGFPIELTSEIVEEHNLKVDLEGFKLELEKQKQRARFSRSKEQSMNVQNEAYLNFIKKSVFVGYETLKVNSKVIGLFVDGNFVEEASGKVLIITEETPFYAESGGQISDKGLIIHNNNKYNVINVFKLPNNQHAHEIRINKSRIYLGENIDLIVNEDTRQDISRNHSATHILNQALRNVLGSHVTQQGSQVNKNRLRFDFNHYKNLTNEEILTIEDEVNQVILKALPIEIIETTMEQAQKRGAQALFGEKYGKFVRMIDNQYSVELCGGTHLKNTKDILRFAILNVESKGSGLFRIEASTGKYIEKEFKKLAENTLQMINSLKNKLLIIRKEAKQQGFEIPVQNIILPYLEDSYRYIININKYYLEFAQIVKDIEKKFENLNRQKKSSNYARFLQKATYNNSTMILIEKVNDYDNDVLKDIIDKLASNQEKVFIFFANIMLETEKIVFIAKAKGININCGHMVKLAALKTGGNGGGRADFAQAGGKHIHLVDDAITLVKQELRL